MTIVWSAWLLCACNLVLGIDDVSSANGPDSGQQISSQKAEPHDASIGARDANASVSSDGGGSASPEPEASPDRLDASAAVDRDANSGAKKLDAAVDDDAGDYEDDAGTPR